MENNGIIQIKDIHGLKTKYKIVNCLTLTKTNKTYLIYTKNSDSDSLITLYVSELMQNNNIIELTKIMSENTLIEIKNILIDIINNNSNNSNYMLKVLNEKSNFLIRSDRKLEIPNKLYKYLKKDYNTNKKVREIINLNKLKKECVIEKIKMAELDFIETFTKSDNYIKIIKNL